MTTNYCICAILNLQGLVKSNLFPQMCAVLHCCVPQNGVYLLIASSEYAAWCLGCQASPFPAGHEM